MPRIDDYKEALKLAKERIIASNLHHLAKKAGAQINTLDDGRVEMALSFLNSSCCVMVDPESGKVDIRGSDGEEISLTDQILIAHYLLNASGEMASGEWVTFRDIPDGHFYYDAFLKRARDPFLKVFGNAPNLFEKVAPLIGGYPASDIGDVAFLFQVFPRISVKIVMWKGDDEFPPEATILFDKNISSYLPAEDIAYMSGGIVYRMMGIARSLQK